MDFNKLNAMIDELNNTFAIIETNTAEVQKDNLERDKELFYNVHDYFVNWMELFEKVRIDKHEFIKIYPYKDCDPCKLWINIKYGFFYANIEYGTSRFECSVTPTYNRKYFEKDIFPHWAFKESVMPTIRAIDFDYVEKQMVEKLNEAITKKAEKIEAEYNKAMQNAWKGEIK